jgi:hypothetical protein
MADNKTVETGASVEAFLDGIADDRRRTDAYALLDLMRQITGVEAKMWGPSIVGFGKYRYRYDSGREGEMLRVGFSPRKANLALYMTSRDDHLQELLARLGRHKHGASCLYITKLSDVDEEVLRAIIARSWMLASQTHGEQEQHAAGDQG